MGVEEVVRGPRRWATAKYPKDPKRNVRCFSCGAKFLSPGINVPCPACAAMTGRFEKLDEEEIL
jgi:rubrerythrin